MEHLFKDLEKLDDLKHLILISPDGHINYKKTSPDLLEDFKDQIWPYLIHTIQTIGEGELMYENGRILMRKTDSGYLIIVAGRSGSAAMVRLHCDICVFLLNRQTKKPSKK